MSHQATAWAYGVRGLTPAQKVVLYQLANRCNEGHEGYERRSICWPSLSRLELDCELSRRGLTQILSVLEGKGVIIRNRNHGYARATGRGGEATLYELPLQEKGGVPLATSVGNPVPDTGEHRLPKSVREPVKTIGNRGNKSAAHKEPKEDAEFAEFYQAYPRKKAPKRARTAFRAARKDASFADIMQGLKAYQKSVKDKKPEFIQHPASWLNGGCWMDRPDGAAGENLEPSDARNVYPGLERMVIEYGPAVWNSWFADCSYLPTKNSLRIVTKGAFQADYIRNHYGGRLSELMGKEVIIEAHIKGDIQRG